MHMYSQQQLRVTMRAQRQALTGEQQSVAEKSLLGQLCSMDVFTTAKSVAVYLSVDGEIATQALIEYCWAQGKAVFLPVIDPDAHHQLLFVRYVESSVMVLNQYGIGEPLLDQAATIRSEQLDLVLLPLVAFDRFGARIGMGGGYYDRSFSFINSKNTKVKTPQLFGLAHDLQQQEKLPVNSWDIPLNAIITDRQVLIAKQ